MQEAKNGNKMQRQFSSLLNEHWKRKQRLKQQVATNCAYRYLSIFAKFLALLVLTNNIPARSGGQSILQSDPRPTIYSGQVSFGLLLSAHSSLGSELSSSSSQQVVSRLLLTSDKRASGTTLGGQVLADNSSLGLLSSEESRANEQQVYRSLGKRQIFERPRGNRYSSSGSVPSSSSSPNHSANQQQQQQQQQPQQQQVETGGPCSQVNANALYAGMGAIWASHQANLVGDSQLAIGTYVYDSCNDLDVGQRQSVRIVSNINAFQQTTCEAPRGSPISLTIAHGDNQLRAIQLLTSFRVPVITSREHFALEEYQALSEEQRRFLFSTAHSSRHLARGAIRFSKQLVSRSSGSPKLLNQFYRMSSRNALIVISRNLPERFVSHLADSIPNQVNYEILQSSQPIEQIQSLEALESILLSSARRHREMESREESRVRASKLAGPKQQQEPAERPRQSTSRRSTSDDQDSSSTDSDPAASGLDPESDSENDSDGTESPPPWLAGPDKMLSPTILMFITPAEAIDLITRLRNDLAEVSRYYSLIVSTREDISPALKTIFQRGGARLCSGKPFFTISPRPDDIGEFSRYFRDTVQLEGDSSDHPLVCEFARYQASSRVSADLDDVSTEPVIKAVWAAAAAFKSIHKRECSSPISSGSSSSSSSAAGSGLGGTSSNMAHTSGVPSLAQNAENNSPAPSETQPHQLAQTRASSAPSGKFGSGSGGAHQTGRGAAGSQQSQECMSKLGKNMSGLVQRALKRLNVTINSTGLQSLDGFAIRFDELQELMTNRFSIRYISKECEITEIGTFSGQMDSRLRMDEPSLLKALEGSLPEPWPAPPPPPPPPRTTPAPHQSSAAPTGGRGSAKQQGVQGGASTSTRQSNSLLDRSSNYAVEETPTPARAPPTSTHTSGLSTNRSRRKQTSAPASSESPESPPNLREVSSVDQDDEQSTPIPVSTRSKFRKRAREFARQKQQRASSGSPPSTTTTTTTTSATLLARNDLREEWPASLDTTESTQSASASLRMSPNPTDSRSTSGAKSLTIRPGRTLKAFPMNALPRSIENLEGLVPASASGLVGVLKGTRNPLVELQSAGSSSTIKPATNIHHQLDHLSAWPTSRKGAQREEPSNLQIGSALRATQTTTQVPSGVHSTLPESDGNADLEIPTRSFSKSSSSSSSSDSSSLSTAASSTQSVQDYVTAPSVTQSQTYYSQIPSFNRTSSRFPMTTDEFSLSSSVTAATDGAPSVQQPEQARRASTSDLLSSSDLSSAQRTRLRSHIKWIYSSWYALSILAANICGALLTLYVLTFLLMKNCDGSLERENQGLRSMHLLAIIVVFFGSTLFIVHPTPALCLLRNSWHNFALVLLFGSLLLQAMQTSSMATIGLGGRPHRLNQFLTLLFMVGVQVSFELQRWRYESSSYLNFVSQHLGGSSSSSSSSVSADQHKKLLMLSRATSDQLNPLSSFTDQLTPVSIQLSEHYQSLLQDYCIQQAADDFLQGQMYLVIVVLLLVAFSLANRRSARLNGTVGSKAHQRLATGKLVASQHEANLADHLSSSHFQLSPASRASSSLRAGNLFAVSLAGACIYFASLALHTYGQSFVNRDLLSSITMVSIAFLALLGIFLPILIQLQRSFGGADSSSSSSTTRNLPLIHSSGRDGAGSDLTLSDALQSALSPVSGRATFAMFPEFAPTGLRRPSSEAGATTSAGSSTGASGSRRLFAESKESRRNMGAALAHLGPSEDSLRSMGFYESRGMIAGIGARVDQQSRPKNSVVAREKHSSEKLSNTSAINEQRQQQQPLPKLPTKTDAKHHHHHHPHHNHHHRSSVEQVATRNHQDRHSQNHHQPIKRPSSSEKRLIMLDVDPCCPRHGVSAWPTSQ